MSREDVDTLKLIAEQLRFESEQGGEIGPSRAATFAEWLEEIIERAQCQ